MIYNPSWSLVSSGPTPRHPSHQQIFWSRSILAGSANSKDAQTKSFEKYLILTGSQGVAMPSVCQLCVRHRLSVYEFQGTSLGRLKVFFKNIIKQHLWVTQSEPQASMILTSEATIISSLRTGSKFVISNISSASGFLFVKNKDFFRLNDLTWIHAGHTSTSLVARTLHHSKKGMKLLKRFVCA